MIHSIAGKSSLSIPSRLTTYIPVSFSKHLAGLRRLEIDSDDLTELGLPPLLASSDPVPVLLVELPAPVVVPRFRDLEQGLEALPRYDGIHWMTLDGIHGMYLVDELMLGWLPPLMLLIGFRSPNRLLLFRGFTIVLDDAERSFRRPFVRSFERSLIFVNVPLGFSGGKLKM